MPRKCRSPLQPRGSRHCHALSKGTICPRSSDPIYIVTYYIDWVTPSLTHSNYLDHQILILLVQKVHFYIESRFLKWTSNFGRKI